MKKRYENPQVCVLELSNEDVLTTSGGDENQGEWT